MLSNLNGALELANLRSELVLNTPFGTFEEFRDKLLRERESVSFNSEKISFDNLVGWHFDNFGNLKHESGNFFSIEALKAFDQEDRSTTFQPIIKQLEKGILGIICKKIEGISYFLMQFKIEPGNIDKIQISPTVQATKSNYTRAHKGKSVPYIEYFVDSKSVEVIYKGLQSEPGNKFYKKRNYNIIVEVKENESIEVLPGFMWMTLGQIKKFLKMPNVINMCSRSVLSTLSYFSSNILNENSFEDLLDKLDSTGRTISNVGKELLFSSINKECSINSYGTILEWLESIRQNKRYNVEVVNLEEIYKYGWQKIENRIYSNDYIDFEVNCLRVNVQSREVSSWTQPIVSDNNQKLNGLIAKKINGVIHILVQACEEIGIYNEVEIGPTLHNVSMSDISFTQFGQYFINKNINLVYSGTLSEEGGRFLHTKNKYMIVLIEDEIDLNENYIWVTLYQMKELIKKECNVNSEARSLISCIDIGV